MASKIGVLIFPAGEINSVELHDALATCVSVKVVGASSIDRHGEYIFDKYISGIPKINDEDFLDTFNQMLDENDIQVVFPTHDDVALFFAKNKNKIKAKVITADYETALICRDKKKTYELFSEETFCPKTYYKLEEFPVFIKPRKGQGSVGAAVIHEVPEIPQNIDLDQYVICEFLPGNEMTVDCFTDKDGHLQGIFPRSRQRIFSGVSVHARNEQLTKEIEKIAKCINDKLNFIGLWYFQIKQDKKGKFKLLEISARCAGTMCMTRARGVNLPLLSVYAAMGKETSLFVNKYNIEIDRTLISRYKTDIIYHTVYMDLDDTILVDGKVYLPAIWFLYQCINSEKKIILLTRHGEDHSDSVKDVLKKHKISMELFDDIKELSFDTPKYCVIEPDGAIFIDNAYLERKLVFEQLQIPVFDVDGIEVLMDWRN